MQWLRTISMNNTENGNFDLFGDFLHKLMMGFLSFIGYDSHHQKREKYTQIVLIKILNTSRIRPMDLQPDDILLLFGVESLYSQFCFDSQELNLSYDHLYAIQPHKKKRKRKHPYNFSFATYGHTSPLSLVAFLT